MIMKVLIGLAVSLVLIATFSLGSTRVGAIPAVQGRDEVRIELTSDGFNPTQVQHAAGTFAIAVENNTLSGNYTLRLKAEDGTLLSELQVQKGSSAWTVSLQAGQYTLTEAGHSQWLCRVVVQ